MASNHLTQDEFLDRLSDLFSQRKGADHGAVYLSQKRLTFGQDGEPGGDGDAGSDLNPVKPMPVIVRASNGKSKKQRDAKVKISTVVQPHDLEDFYLRYADICKSGMIALKPRDRSKKKAKAKKKKVAS